MLEPLPNPAAHPTVASYTLADLIADLDDNLAELEEQSQPDRLTPLQVETAILQTLSQQITTLLARERLELRAALTTAPAVTDALADLDVAIAATAARLATLRCYRRFDELSPAQRQTIITRTAALDARLLAGRARLHLEQAQREEREDRAQSRMVAPVLPAPAAGAASMTAYSQHLAQLLTPPPATPMPSPDAFPSQAATGDLFPPLHASGAGRSWERAQRERNGEAGHTNGGEVRVEQQGQARPAGNAAGRVPDPGGADSTRDPVRAGPAPRHAITASQSKTKGASAPVGRRKKQKQVKKRGKQEP
jgi:hypothetical protein